MKNSLLLLLILILSSFSSQAKKKVEAEKIFDYLRLIHDGKYYYLIKNYHEARKCFIRAFKLHKPINFQETREFERFVHIDFLLNKVNKSTFKNIETMIRDYGYDFDFFENDSDYKLDSLVKNWEYIKKNYPSWRLEYLTKINIPIRNKIDSMRQLDQKYRKLGLNKENASMQSKIDSSNLVLVKNIFEKYGYPNEKVIGLYNIDNRPVNVEIILLHSPDSIRVNYFLPKIKEFILQGKCYPEVYARLVDQYHIYNRRNQIYGTLTSSNQQLIMVSDPNKVDSARFTLGLPKFKRKVQMDSISFLGIN